MKIWEKPWKNLNGKIIYIFMVKLYIKYFAHFNKNDEKIKYLILKRLNQTMTERITKILPIWNVEPYIPNCYHLFSIIFISFDDALTTPPSQQLKR